MFENVGGALFMCCWFCVTWIISFSLCVHLFCVKEQYAGFRAYLWFSRLAANRANSPNNRLKTATVLTELNLGTRGWALCFPDAVTVATIIFLSTFFPKLFFIPSDPLLFSPGWRELLILEPWRGQNTEQRSLDYNTHRGSATLFSAQDTITPLYIYITIYTCNINILNFV